MKRIAACLALAAATAGAALPAAAQGAHSLWVKGGWDDPSPVHPRQSPRQSQS